MRAFTRPFLLVIFALALLPVSGFAQVTTGSISGTISDDSGASLPGVTVTGRNVATGATRTSVTDSAGRFELPILQPGTYTVTGDLDGFRPATASNVVVSLSGNVSLTMRMSVGVSETVTLLRPRCWWRPRAPKSRPS